MTTTITKPIKIYSPQEAADRLGLSLSRIHQFCQAGRLGQRVGGCYVITADDLRNFSKQPRYPGRPSEKRAS